jgi:hypothetical protein
VESLLALSGKLNGLHWGGLVVAGGILGIDQGIMVKKIKFPMEKVGGGGDGLGYVGEHVGHVLIDAGQVRVVVDPVSIFCE